MKKIRLEDMTFTIPLRFDSMIRLENAITVVSFLYKNFNTNIMVLEASPFKNNIFASLIRGKAEYIHYQDYDTIFHKTKYSNMMVQNVSTPFFAIWDTDVIIDRYQILDAIEKLRKSEADISYPYSNNCFLDTSDILRLLFLKTKKINILHKYKEWMYPIYGMNVCGGAVFINIEKHKLAGLDNEDFYGWGHEDTYRQRRWEKLNYKIYNSDGPLYHLSHPRDINGFFRSIDQVKRLTNFLNKLDNSSVKEIRDKLSI